MNEIVKHLKRYNPLYSLETEEAGFQPDFFGGGAADEGESIKESAPSEEVAPTSAATSLFGNAKTAEVEKPPSIDLKQIQEKLIQEGKLKNPVLANPVLAEVVSSSSDKNIQENFNRASELDNIKLIKKKKDLERAIEEVKQELQNPQRLAEAQHDLNYRKTLADKLGWDIPFQNAEDVLQRQIEGYSKQSAQIEEKLAKDREAYAKDREASAKLAKEREAYTKDLILTSRDYDPKKAAADRFTLFLDSLKNKQGASAQQADVSMKTEQQTPEEIARLQLEVENRIKAEKEELRLQEQARLQLEAENRNKAQKEEELRSQEQARLQLELQEQALEAERAARFEAAKQNFIFGLEDENMTKAEELRLQEQALEAERAARFNGFIPPTAEAASVVPPNLSPELKLQNLEDIQKVLAQEQEEFKKKQQEKVENFLNQYKTQAVQPTTDWSQQPTYEKPAQQNWEQQNPRTEPLPTKLQAQSELEKEGLKNVGFVGESYRDPLKKTIEARNRKSAELRKLNREKAQDYKTMLKTNLKRVQPLDPSRFNS